MSPKVISALIVVRSLAPPSAIHRPNPPLEKQ
jgi:hypothetical protein